MLRSLRISCPPQRSLFTLANALRRGYQTSFAFDGADEFFEDSTKKEAGPNDLGWRQSDHFTIATDESITGEAPALPTYHELSGGGYSGRLASAFRSRHRANIILEIMETMKRVGERPSTTLAYNYMLSALLEKGKRKEAFMLLREMEARQMQPDLFTFEQVLFDLSRDIGLAITVEELVHLMRVKYNIRPSASCWTSRLKVWIGRHQDQRVLALFEEMRRTDARIASDPSIYTNICKTALLRNSWEVASHVLSCLTPTVPLTAPAELEYRRVGVQPTNPPVMLTSIEYQSIFQVKMAGLSLWHVPFIRFLLRQLDPVLMDEGSYARILYFAATTGRSVADLAYAALCKLSRLYDGCGSESESGGGSGSGSGDGGAYSVGGLALPRHYLEAYFECISSDYQDQKSFSDDPNAVDPSLFYQNGLLSKHQKLAEEIEKIMPKYNGS